MRDEEFISGLSYPSVDMFVKIVLSFFTVLAADYIMPVCLRENNRMPDGEND